MLTPLATMISLAAFMWAAQTSPARTETGTVLTSQRDSAIELLERAPSRMTAQGSQDLGKFQGRWVFETFNGDPAPAAPNEVSLVVSGSKYQQFFGNKVAEEGSIRADVTKTPNWFDLVIEKGGDAGRVQPGLVSVEGEVMMLSLALPGEARPASKEAAHLQMVARRVK